MEYKEILSEIEKLENEISSIEINNAQDLEAFRIKFLGSKNVLKDIFAFMKIVPNEEKKNFGLKINSIKNSAEEKFNNLKPNFEEKQEKVLSVLDLTRSVDMFQIGNRHPISIIRRQIIEIFEKIGFVIAEGPEIEDDWHNFTALNTPEDHPSRDMQDTFYVQTNPALVLRSQTSTVQVRVMEKQKPPIRIISPGRVYRNETISARAGVFFHQVECLFIAEKVSFADLKQCLDYFAKEMFGQNTKIRLRPSYFPFTEPSAEMDISCFICNQNGCPVCKGSGWVEILGCGMVDPSVLTNCGIDAENYSGFALGMGIERIAMLKYKVNDLRVFYENDMRFLKQFLGE
jgi:phenylalanyl-tRNA synthetase alpha chain